MSLTRKLGTAAFVVAGALAIGGCGFLRNYVRFPIVMESNRTTIKIYDQNKDSKADKMIISIVTKQKNVSVIHTTTSEDTDFNGSFDKFISKQEHQNVFPPKYELCTLLDKDNDGVYEKAILEAEQLFSKKIYEFSDLDKDDTFDKCICTKAETFLDEERTKDPEFLKKFNVYTALLKWTAKSDSRKYIKKFEK